MVAKKARRGDNLLSPLAQEKALTFGTGKAPLYGQLADILTGKIERAEYKKGDLLPGDVQLAAEYKLSLITVRAAMRMLMGRGLIARYPGKGSFVINQQQVRAQWGLGSINDLDRTGSQAKFVLLKRLVVPAPEWVAQMYSYPSGAKVYWFRAAREQGGERFLVNDTYHSIPIGERINKLDFDDENIRTKLMVRLVEEYCDVRLSEMNQSMSAEVASADIAKTLRIKVGQPILVIDREYFSGDGELMQVTRSRYRVDHYRYTINLSRIGSGGGSADDRPLVATGASVAI